MVYTLEECCEDLVNMTTPEMFLFLEGTSPEVKESFGKKLLQKIMDIKNALTKWISEFFQKTFNKQTEARINQALDAKPELKNKKIQIKDQEKLRKLQEETINEINSAKTPEEVKAAKEKYKKRKVVIGVVTVSVAAAVGLLAKRKRDRKIDELFEQVKNDIESLDAGLRRAELASYKLSAANLPQDTKKNEKLQQALRSDGDTIRSNIKDIRRGVIYRDMKSELEDMNSGKEKKSLRRLKMVSAKAGMYEADKKQYIAQINATCDVLSDMATSEKDCLQNLANSIRKALGQYAGGTTDSVYSQYTKAVYAGLDGDNEK